LQGDLEIKLLELTRKVRTVELAELAEKLRMSIGSLSAQISTLQQDGLISTHDSSIQLDDYQRILLAEHLIQKGRDPHRVSRFLEWQEFEDFAARTLERNGFHTAKHVVFKSDVGRREIDLLAWNDMLLLSIDCKHWLHGLSPSRMRHATDAQVERTRALANRPELIAKHGVKHVERRRLLPMLLSLGHPRERIVDGVPIVPVSMLMSFLGDVSPVDGELRFCPCGP
jgi:Holliday junction resolvase-like predicted endonuclease